MTEKSTEAAKSSAYKFLSYRPRSINEIQKRLLQKFDEEIVDITITWLIKNELVNDEKFAIWWTESRVRQKLLSSSMIRKELLEKQVSLNVINNVVRNVDDNLNAHLLAQRISHKIDTQDAQEFKRKLYDRLIRRGFSSGIVLISIDKVWNCLVETRKIGLQT